MPPCNDFVKVNVNASWKQGMDVGSVGVIIRRTDGSFLASFSGLTNASSSIDAETSAILEGCKFALHEGLNNVIIEFDSREAISSVHGSIARGRTANLAADHLAKLSSSRILTFVWVNRPSSSLTDILNKNDLPCPPPQNG
ncbi:hypothetical protein L3X38_033742 [Prunus dulcis]|uniref:RNase H type-1 domain-containing protein n=1 Tax=Prunus dulcis TaxID=3755 RepID=A0AAD4YX80_PRUDU|nr:hypothetical protein L3X38_033742 [Prunus dulcis]